MGAGLQIVLRLHLMGSVHYFTPCSKQLRKEEMIIISIFIDGETECREIVDLPSPHFKKATRV